MWLIKLLIKSQDQSVSVSAIVSNRADAKLITLIKHFRNQWHTPSTDTLMRGYWLTLAHIGFLWFFRHVMSEPRMCAACHQNTSNHSEQNDWNPNCGLILYDSAGACDCFAPVSVLFGRLDTEKSHFRWMCRHPHPIPKLTLKIKTWNYKSGLYTQCSADSRD